MLVAATDDASLANRTVALTGPETLRFAEIVRRVGAAVGRTPRIARGPVWFHRALAVLLEATTRVPLVARAQVRILEEGLVEPWGEVDQLPDDLAPTLRFTPDRVRELLPRDRGAIEEFGLRCCPARTAAH
ncbi:MAG: hypothetical protein R3F34_17985 [Planctomycetota bacterium]